MRDDSTPKIEQEAPTSNSNVKLRQCGWRVYEDLPQRPDKYRCCGGQAHHAEPHEPANGGSAVPGALWLPGPPVTGIAELLAEPRHPTLLYACEFGRWTIELHQSERQPFRSVARWAPPVGAAVYLEAHSISALEALHLARDRARDFDQVILLRAELQSREVLH